MKDSLGRCENHRGGEIKVSRDVFVSDFVFRLHRWIFDNRWFRRLVRPERYVHGDDGFVLDRVVGTFIRRGWELPLSLHHVN